MIRDNLAFCLLSLRDAGNSPRAMFSTDVREEVYEELGVNRKAASADQGHYIRSFNIARRHTVVDEAWRGRGREARAFSADVPLQIMWGGSCGSRKRRVIFLDDSTRNRAMDAPRHISLSPFFKEFLPLLLHELGKYNFFLTWVGFGPGRPSNFLDMLMYSA